MARTYAKIEDVIQQMLQDAGGAVFDSPELGYWIEEGLKEFAKYDPHIVPVIFKIESRTGADTAGTTDALTDTTESQFLSADATNEKVVRNTTDSTWAVVLTQSSTSVLTLNADIMGNGDSYEIYNKRCDNKKQIYIGDVTDYSWIDSVEYPVGQKRNWEVFNEVLEIGVNIVADSDTTKTNLPNVDVLIRFAKPHRLCQLADLTGEVHTEGSKGATTLQVKTFTDAEVVEIGDEFFIANHRTLYTVTTGVTLDNQASTGSQIGFYPGLEAVAPVGDVVTFTKSTLKPQHEELFSHLVAARASISKGMKSILEIETAISTLSTVNTAIDNMTTRITQSATDLASGRTEAAKTPALIDLASTAIGSVQAQITLAIADLVSGRSKINEINKGGANVPTTYVSYATAELGNANGLIRKARAYFNQATKDESIAGTYGELGARELQGAAGYLTQAGGYVREISSRLEVAASWTQYQGWGERKLDEVKLELRGLRPGQTKRTYTRS